MRKPLVAGNWKMNNDGAAARRLFQELNSRLGEIPAGTQMMIAPPAIYLSELASLESVVGIGSQDVSAHQASGAFTGEFSAGMLKSIGVEYAIVGHSERRAYHGETDELIGEKVAACIAAGIVPVYCCGEALEEREAGNHFGVVKNQIKTALFGFAKSELENLVIAYEPVWAIGTGKTASAEQAQDMHAEIRLFMKAQFGADLSDHMRILYGGSCKPNNAESIFSKPDVDGGLIGGAALNADDFLAIVKATK